MRKNIIFLNLSLLLVMAITQISCKLVHPTPTDAGWEQLVNADLSNMEAPKKNWYLNENGELTADTQGGADIWTTTQYDNFMLDLEYKVGPKANSGIFLRAQNHGWFPWMEVQVEDSYGKPVAKNTPGAIYDIKEPTINAVKPAGQWNRMTITANGPLICVVLNDQKVVDINLDDWTTAHQNPDGSENKFDIPYKDLPRSGWIGFQGHTGKVWYRNIRIKKLL
ncbi:MAG: DUF1080 domain-containing protein [Phycisphaerae bacterium]|nr:DUF1080 domain-containing protein [Phycisphaerae bacterium]